MKQSLYVFLGFLFLGIALVGVVLPILPTVPFLLLTSFFFIRGSERVNAWFVTTSVYQKHVVTFQEKKGLTLKAKLWILIPVYGMLVGLFFAKDILAMRIVIVILLAVKTFVFIKMKTIAPEELLTNDDAE